MQGVAWGSGWTTQASLIVEVFGMLADLTRIQPLWALTDGELSAEFYRLPCHPRGK